MSVTKSSISLGLLAAMIGLTSTAQAQGTSFLSAQAKSGQILGEIKGTGGVPQMGANVFLYNRFDHLVRQVLSNENGRFGFDGLAPDTYSIRVTLASFVPAWRRNIAVLAGAEQLLRINLNNLFSSVELVPPAIARGALMSEDWKWVLRSSQSTRPVLRILDQTANRAEAELFAETKGVVRLSAGDTGPGQNAQDLGTAFGLETSVAGATKVRVTANLGYSPASGLPSAGFRTSYKRERDGLAGPTVSLTVRQVYFPSSSIINAPSNAPVLRTAALSSIDSIDIMDGLKLEYGASMETLALYGRMTYFSPFARATYQVTESSAVRVAFSSGATPTDLVGRGPQESDFNQDFAALSQLPRLSRRGADAQIERTKSYEAAYEVVDGSRTWTFAAYRDDVSNAAFLLSGGTGLIQDSELLPDLNSRGVLFNLGSFQRTGYSAAMKQGLGEHFEIGMAVGRGGALIANTALANDDADALRAHIGPAQRMWATLRVAGSLPVTGTWLSAGYGWTDFNALTPTHVSLTGAPSQQVGWNVQTRQPLPGVGGMRMELMAEVRNALAQGYLNVDPSQGQRTVLTNSPRAVRGGLSFIF